MILRIHHVQITIPAGAETAAREFYCGILGLFEVAKPEANKARGGLWLELGNQQIHIGIQDEALYPKGKEHLAYVVDDLEALKQKLVDYGIVISDASPVPGFVRFQIRDPFGNRVEFLQETS